MNDKAKRHQILRDMAAEMNGRHIQKDVVVERWTFTIRTLKPVEQDWVMSKAENSFGDPAKLMMFQVRPLVAASLVAVNGVSVEELFALPDDMSADIKLALQRDEKAMRSWRLSQVLEFVGEELQEEIVAPLWNAITMLKERQVAAEGALGKV